MSDLKNRLESILFAAGKPLKLEELSRLTRERDLEAVRKALLELQQELEQKKGSVMLINEGDEWKLSVREKYLPFIRKIVTKTELPKSVIETLAVVAFKAPVLQSKVIHIRTNKAYKHLDFLEEKGYIIREKKGRTKLIKLTQKFFDYFDVPPEKLKQRFQGFEELDKAIEEMETPPEVDLVDEEGHAVELKQYTTEPELEPYTKTPSPVEKYSETVDGLQVYGEKKEEKKEAKEEKHKKKKAKEKEKKKEDKEKKKEDKEKEEIEEKPEKEESEAQKKDKEEKPAEKRKDEEEDKEKEEKGPERKEKKDKDAEKETEEKEKPEKKHKEKKKKEKPKKEEKQEEPKKEEPHKQITAEEVREQAKKLAATKETAQEYESEGIFKGEIPKELEQKIEKRAQEIAYGKKEAAEGKDEERKLSFEKKPAIRTEEKKEIPTKEKPKIQAEKKPQLPQTPKVPKPPKPETKKKKKKKTKEKTLLG